MSGLTDQLPDNLRFLNYEKALLEVQHAVNLQAAPSALPSGLDLPLTDIATLRYFFNIGVRLARVIVLSQRLQLMPNGGMLQAQPAALQLLLQQLQQPIDPLNSEAIQPNLISSNDGRDSTSFETCVPEGQHFDICQSAEDSTTAVDEATVDDELSPVYSSSSPADYVPLQLANDRSSMAPSLMVAYLNSCLLKAKRSLRHRGISLPTMDDKGMPVDFSALPIDPIFKEARARFEEERSYLYSPKTRLSSESSDIANDSSISSRKRPSTHSFAIPSLDDKRRRFDEVEYI